MTYQNRGFPQGCQWLRFWMGLTATPPVLLALLLLAGLSSGAEAQTNPTISPTEIYEGETLKFTIATADSDDGSLWFSFFTNGALNASFGFAASSTADGGIAETNDFNLRDINNSGSQLKLNADDVTYRSDTVQELDFLIRANTDNTTEEDETIVIELTSDLHSIELTAITLKDGARPALGDGVTLSETSLALTELGTSSAMEKTYTVVLNTDPTADVTITVANGDATAVAVDTNSGTDGNQNTLTFTAGGDGSGSGANGNWAVAQTVTVWALNDGDTASESFNLTHTATTTGNTGPYNGITIDPVAINMTDAGHGVVVSEASLSVMEDETATYTVALKSQPSSTVEISSTLTGSDKIAISPVTLTFTQSNWNTPQTMTVTGKEAGLGRSNLFVSATTTNYPDSTDIIPVVITVTAAPTAGLTIIETDGDTTVSEDGTTLTDTYTVVLNTEPTHDVTVTVTSGDTAAATVNPGTLTFTTSNYSTSQTVTVTGVDDSTDNPGGGRDVTISHGASSTDSNYTIANAGTVAARVTDDDATTLTLISPAGNLQEGQTKAFQITLSRGLVDGETLTVPLNFSGTATRGTDYTMTGTTVGGVQYNNLDSGSATVVFTGPESGATFRTASIALSATADSTVESTGETVDINFGSITHTGLEGVGGVSTRDFLEEFRIFDQDAAGVTVDPTSLSLTELGDSSTIEKTYTVVLDTNPGSGTEVTIFASPSNVSSAEVSWDGIQYGRLVDLSFNSSNWNTAHTVTVRALNDANAVDETLTINHRTKVTVGSVVDPSNPYHGLAIDPTVISVMDAGHGVVVSEASLLLLNSDEEATYTVALKSQPSGDVEISATSGATGTATVSPATLTFTDSDWNTPQTVTVTGKGAGSTSISHAVSTTADATNYPTSTTISPVAITVRPTVNLERPANTGTYSFYTVNEGETGQIDVILSGALDADVEIPVTLTGFAHGTSDDYTEPNPSSVTIPAGQTRATLSIVTTDDKLVEGYEGVRISIDTDNLPGTVRLGTTGAASFYIIDNDGLLPSIGTMALTELGSPSEVEKTYSIVLKTDPADANITVTVRSNKEAAARVKIGSGPFGEQAKFTFTPGNSGNWNTEQTVTVQAVNDGDGDNERFGISHQLTVSGSNENHPYSIARSGNVVVTITDAGHGVVVSETSFSLLDSDEEATYTVALKSQPSGDVEISATSGATGTATVSPATLTFTDSDWNTPQTVTVTGKGAGSTSISHAVSTTADATNYPTSTTISPVAITVTADTRSTVNLERPADTGTYGLYAISEGGTGQIDVTLSGALGADVEIPVTLTGFARGTSDDYTEPNPSSVTIPAGQTRATLSIVTTDDKLVEGYEGVRISIDTDNLPGTVRLGTTGTTSLYIIDNDGLVPSLTVEETMALTELGGPSEVEKTYSIVLKTDPVYGNFVVTVSVGDAAQVKIGSGPFGRQATFTFTPGNSGNWNTEQTVTVRAVNDGDVDDERLAIRHNRQFTFREDHPYAVARTGHVFVTITDAGHGVVVSETSFSLLDSDEEATYTVALKSQPSGDVEISATSGATGTATVSPATLTFTDSDWNTPQTVTVTGKGAGSTSISHAVSTTADATNYPTSTTISPVAITVTADNRPTVNLENPGYTGTYSVYAVNEGEAGQIDVTLSGALGADVEIPVIVSGDTGGTADDYTEPNPSSVTIPAGQTRATLSIVTTDDKLPEGYESVTVRIDTDNLPGTVRAGTTVADAFYIIDNDGLLPSIGTMALTELGGPNEVEKTYSIVLKTDPVDTNIIVTVRVGGAAQVKIGSGPFGRQATFTFTPGNSGNWNTDQTVTVRAVNDGDGDDERFAISHTTSNVDQGNPYIRARAPNVVVTITDAGHGVVVSEASFSLLDSDEEATYTVALKSQPSGDVEISATSGATGTATVSPATLTFTDSDWNTPQTVTVTGKGAGSTSISHAVSTTADATNYPTSTTVSPVAITVTAVVPNAGLIITETDGDTTVSEDGTTLTDTYTIALSTEPTHNVTVTVTAGAEAQVNKTDGTAGSEQTLTFTPSGTGIWSAAQTITVTGVDDNIDNTGNERTVSITHAATSTDPNYIITNAGSVSVTVADDDTDGVTVSETTRTVSEDSGTATYTVALDTEPLSNVTITVTSDDDTVVKLDGPDNATAYTDTEDLVFTPSNWNTLQTVTIQGQNDNIFNSRTRTATITHKITSEGNGDGSRYTPTAPVIASVLVTLTDDEDGPRLTLSPTTIGTEAFNNGGTVTITLIPKSTTFFGAGKDLPPIIDRPYVNSEDLVEVPLDEDSTYQGIPNSQVRLNANGLGLITLSDHPTGLTIDAGRLLARQTNQESVHSIKNHRSVEIDLSYSGSAITANDQVTITVDNDLLRFAQSLEKDRPPDLSATFTLEPPPTPAGGVTISETSLSLTELGTSSTMEKTYTVVLDTDPIADVTITVANGDATAVAVDTDSGTSGNQNSLTFTAGGDGSGSGTGNGNWAVAQTVTVWALNDGDGANESFNLTHTATTTGSTAPYHGITIDPVAITTTDAGHGVVGSEASLSVAENDQTATYTVVLKSQPGGNVEISTTSGATATATASPATLTFGSSNWNTPQTVTVTGKGAGSTSISHAVATSADTTNYPTSTTIPAVAVTVTAVAGLVIIETDDDTTVSEDGTTLTDTYTMALRNEPTHDVTVTVTSGDTAAATVNPGTLTFTTSNYSTAQTVTVTGVDDFIDNVGDKRTVTISHTATSTDTDYNGIDIEDVTATVEDDDTGSVSIAESDGSTLVTEAAGDARTDTYTMVLGTLPAADVKIAVTSGATAIATVSPATLTFTTANWNTPQTVTVTGVDDNVDQSNNRSATISHTATSTDTDYSGIDIDDVTAMVVDDDGAGVTIDESDGSTSVTEATGAGRTDTYTVVLDALPSASVEIAVVSGATGAATVSPATLAFTTSTWNTAQTVTVTGVDDDVDNTDDARSATISHTATSMDTDYSGIDIDDVTATVVDNDTASITITQSDGSTSVSEAAAGRTDTYTVVLDALPSASVEIAVVSGDTGAAMVSPATLTFTTGNWNTAQTVTVTGVDDNVDQSSNRSATISHTATSTDTDYSGINIDDVTATVVDNDTAGATISASDGISVTEAAGTTNTESYTVVLDTLPTASVEIAVASDATAIATVSPATLTFTTANWNTAQTVTVTGVDDDVDNTNDARSATISHTATSTDTGYSGIDIDDVTTTVVDNDTAGATISASDGISVTEAAGTTNTESYTVVLDTLPTATVEIAVASGATTIATVSPATLTFTTGNWNTAQTVTVTGVDDNVDQSSNRSATISHTATSTDPGYSGIDIDDVTTTVVDNDTAGATISASDGISVTEAAGTTNTESYTVVLDTLPTASVEIAVVSDATAIATVSPATLTFTISNWNTAQTVTVTGVDDNVDQSSNRSATISHTATSTDTDYSGINIDDVTATVVDDDGAGVTINESDGSTSVTEATGLGRTDTYTVVLASLPSASVEIAVASGATGAATVVPATLTFTTANWNTAQTVTVTGVDDNVDQSNNRSATISHTATSTDTDYSGINIDDVTATVVDNDTAGATISASDGISVTEAAGTTNTESYTVVLDTLPTASVEIAVASDATAIATVSPATLTFTTANWNTPQTVTVTGVDDNVDQSNNRSATISHTATSTDTDYSGINIDDVTATVVDNDDTAPPSMPAVQFGAAAYSGGEASGSRTVNVSLSAIPAFTSATTISYTVSGTATAGEDFAPLTGTVSMAGGAGSVPITILDDQIDDDGEVILLTLTAASDYTVGPQESAIITITDDDGVTPPTPALPMVGITGVGSVTEGEEAIFTMIATPAPPTGDTISVNVMISGSGDFTGSGQTGVRSIVIDDSGIARFTVSIEDDTTDEDDGAITATVQEGSGYTPHDSNSSASITVEDNDPVLLVSVSNLEIMKGGSTFYTIALDTRPTSDVIVTISFSVGEGITLNLNPNFPPMGLTFTPANWDSPHRVNITVPENSDVSDASVILTHTASGGGYPSAIPSKNVMVTVMAADPVVTADPVEEKAAWHLRFGRTLSHQVVDALQDRLSAPPPPVDGLQLTVAGETITSATPLTEHEGVLAKALGFNPVTSEALVEGSSFNFAPEQEGEDPHLAFWGQGALSSFDGQEDAMSLDGDVTTLLLGADWNAERWQAGAALSQSWGSGSYDGSNGAEGEISSTVTGLFPYGRYALTPRLGLWATAGYGWGQLFLKPDGTEDEDKSDATMGMAAIGIDGVLLDGGSSGITLSTNADVLTVKIASEEADGLESSEGNISRHRIGLEAVRPFPFAHGAFLIPSMEMGIRHDSGDAESGYGLDLGAGILWSDPGQGISGELKGHTLLTHTEENLQEQGLSLSFSWEPSPSNRGPSLSVSHAMGAIASGGMDALLNPTTFEGLDANPSSSQQQFEAELAYGFPAHHDHITLTPALALALSPTSRNYSLLWSLAPYSDQEQGQADPWELSLAGEWQEQNGAASPVEHSLKLRFSLLF